ncbi:MAG: YbgA family protein [Anaerolineae bacterium]|nr:YbgA family protein [Anaerolineae bacterium]
MGRLVAKAGSEPWDEMVPAYGVLLMEGLSVLGTRGKHVNVLQHLMGYLKNELSGTAKTRVEFLATPETRPHRVRGGDDTEGGWQSVRYFLSFYTTFSPPRRAYVGI